MQSVRVFLNAKASHGDGQRWQQSIREYLFRSDIQFESPRSLEDFQSKLKQAVEDHVDVIISVGGDGTCNLIAQQLVGSKTAFLVVPAGTANDLANELGMKESFRDVMQCVRNDRLSTIDLIKINEQYMLTNGGIGLASEVASRVNQLRSQVPAFKKLMSVMNQKVYSSILATRAVVYPLKTYQLNLQWENKSRSVETPLLLINNQRQLAGSFNVAPHTNNQDGIFNVTIFKHLSKYDFLQSIYRIKNGMDPVDDPQIESFETSQLSIELEPSEEKPIKFFGDGELWRPARRWNVSVAPRSLKVYHLYNNIEAKEAQA